MLLPKETLNSVNEGVRLCSDSAWGVCLDKTIRRCYLVLVHAWSSHLVSTRWHASATVED